MERTHGPLEQTIACEDKLCSLCAGRLIIPDEIALAGEREEAR